MYIEGLCHGNLSIDEAIGISNTFKSILSVQPLPMEMRHQERVLCLPLGASLIRNVCVKNKLEVNSVVEVIEIGGQFRMHFSKKEKKGCKWLKVFCWNKCIIVLLCIWGRTEIRMALGSGIIFFLFCSGSVSTIALILIRGRKVGKQYHTVSSFLLLSCPKCIIELIVIYSAKHFKLLAVWVYLEILQQFFVNNHSFFLCPNFSLQLYFQIEPDEGMNCSKLRAIADLFDDIVEEPFFYQLR